MADTCPSCARPAEGRFCPHCGTGLGAPGKCAACDSTLPPDASFCNQCGTPVGAAPVAGGSARSEAKSSNLAWIITGLALAGLIAILLIPRLDRDEPAAAAIAPVQGDPTGVDLSSMTPRQAADRLFNRVMTSVAAGDSAQARAFLPMAIGAYARVQDLDLDGRYHLAVLHLVGQDPGSARAEADAILAADPNHLFGLFSAAQAELARGDSAAARQFFAEFLGAYDEEIERGLSGYQDHANALPVMREEAERQVDSS